MTAARTGARPSTVPSRRAGGGSRYRAALGVAFAVLLLGHLVALYWPRLPVTGPAGSDKLAHVALFAVPAVAGVLATGRWRPVLAFTGHAPVSELVQALAVPGRSGDVGDLVADLVGVAIAVVVLVGRRELAGRPDRSPKNTSG